MTKLKTPKLKVFQAQFGFYDTVVAAPSQAAAMRAWGISQNVFADGQARVTTDVAAVKAAQDHPLTVLKRPVGSHDPFEIDPSGLPNMPVASGKGAATKTAAKQTPSTLKKPPPSRTALSNAEAALQALEEARRGEEADFQRRQDDLDAEREDARRDYAKRRRSISERIEAARQTYRQAGGRGD